MTDPGKQVGGARKSPAEVWPSPGVVWGGWKPSRPNQMGLSFQGVSLKGA